MVKIKLVEKTYEINGKKLKEEMARRNIPQVDIAEACGHKDGTRICHILSKDTVRMSWSKLQPIVEYLQAHGVSVKGI